MAWWRRGNAGVCKTPTAGVRFPSKPHLFRRRARVVDRTGLENQHGRKVIGGSNPSVSAPLIYLIYIMRSNHFNNITNEVNFKKVRIVRILIHTKNNLTHLGTGFFVSNTDVITNSHVVFGMGLKKLNAIPDFNKASYHESEITKLYKSITAKSTIELHNGTIKEVFLKHIDTKYDIVVLRLTGGNTFQYFFQINTVNDLNYGDNMQFCGYQTAPYIDPIHWPFTYNTGKISAFPNTYIEGERYSHIQINSINLGGNSGAPLFRRMEKYPIGIINGNQNWGNDNMAFVQKDGSILKDSFRVPLSVAYATSFELLTLKSSIFGEYSKELIKFYKY